MVNIAEYFEARSDSPMWASIIKCLNPERMWYQRMQKLKTIKPKINLWPFKNNDSSLNEFWLSVEKYINASISGKVIKKTYIPDILCVIEIRAETGRFILRRSI